MDTIIILVLWDIHAFCASLPIDIRSTSTYCVFIDKNLITWKGKKQKVVARSNVEAKYRAIASTSCDLSWLKHLLKELRIGGKLRRCLSFVITKFLFILSLFQYFTRGPNISRWIVTSSEKRFYLVTLPLSLLIVMIKHGAYDLYALV